MSMPLRIDSPDALRQFIEARIPVTVLGALLRATFNALEDAFDIFYARFPKNAGDGYESFHPTTAINTIPGLIRSRLEGRFPNIANQFQDLGIRWEVGSNTSKNHGHLGLLIGDDLRIIVTKYNNGTSKINVNKKKLSVAVMNEVVSLFPHLIEDRAVEESDARQTIFIVYGYESELLESFEFNADLINYIDLVFSGIDAATEKVKQISISMIDYAAHMPEQNISISIIPPADSDDDIELRPNEATEQEVKRKLENEE